MAVTRPPSVWKNLKGVIPATSQVDLDVIAFSKFYAATYYMRFSNDAEEKTKSLKLEASKKGADVNDSISERLGDTIDIDVNVLKIGSDTVLRLVNNESYDVEVKASRNLF